MPRRFGELTRLFVYAYLCERDSEKCSQCGKIPTVLYDGQQSISPASRIKLEIDHINENPHDNRFSNLRLLCKQCNIAMRNKIHLKKYSALNNERERVRKEGNVSTRIIKQVVDYDDPDAPATMRANARYELVFRTWLLGLLREREFVKKSDAINGGAEIAGCSPVTAERYLKKLTNPFNGPLKETKDALGNTIITWKDYLQSEKTTEDK
jgi:hypothetical protein